MLCLWNFPAHGIGTDSALPLKPDPVPNPASISKSAAESAPEVTPVPAQSSEHPPSSLSEAVADPTDGNNLADAQSSPAADGGSFTPAAFAAAPESTPSQAPATPAASAEPASAPQAVPPYDPSMVIGGEAGPIELTMAQVKFLQNVLKALKGRAEAKAFLVPVDPIALAIPHYRSIIHHPMDLGTIDIKLALTAATLKGGNKPTEKVKMAPRFGLDVRRDVYHTYQEVEDDVRLTFQNTRTFNGPLHLISLSADALEQVFDKQIKSLPATNAPVVPRKSSIDPLADPRSTMDPGRPKREVHPPPPPIPYVDQEAPLKPSNKYRRESMSLAEEAHWDKVARDEVRFCGKVINELLKPVHSDFAWVFYDLPDHSLDYAPAYYAMIQRPVALTTVLNTLRRGGYADADEFNADMQQLFANCFTFNPPGSDVHTMGQRLKTVYDKTFAKLPEPKPYLSEAPSTAFNEPSEAVQLALLLREQAEIFLAQAAELEAPKPSPKALLRARSVLTSIGALEPASAPSPGQASSAAGGQKRRKSMTSNGEAPSKKPPAKKPKKTAPAAPASARAASPAAISSISATAVPEAPTSVPKKPPAKRARKSKPEDMSGEEDVRVVTYEQKEELANKIQVLTDERMDGALKIIAEDRPGSTIDDEEIELDIDDLSPRTLYKLYRYVVRPKDKKTTHSKPVKNANDGRKRGTGGLKGKTLNESEETERILRLQAQLQQFEGSGASAPAASAVGTAHDDLVNSESSGEEESDSGEDY